MKKFIIAVGIGALLMGTSAMADNNGAIVINEDGESVCIVEMKVPGAFGLWNYIC